MNGRDTEQLHWLSIMYYVWAVLTLLFAVLGAAWIAIIYDAIGKAEAQGGGGPPLPFKQFVTVLAAMTFLIAGVVAALSAWTGRCIAARRHYTFCIVIAALTCLSFPLGTALGVFTLIVLTRPTVKGLFMPIPATVS